VSDFVIDFVHDFVGVLECVSATPGICFALQESRERERKKERETQRQLQILSIDMEDRVCRNCSNCIDSVLMLY